MFAFAVLSRCPDRNAKTRVLKEMVFPNCEKLGQTIIFVRTREAARSLHSAMEGEGYKCTSITVSQKPQALLYLMLFSCSPSQHVCGFLQDSSPPRIPEHHCPGFFQGDMEHSDRDRVVQEFRDGITKILIATDVLSRGFDVSQVWSRE